MKTYYCDICKKEMGHNVSFGHKYHQSDFSIDGGFYYKEQADSDVCADCYNRIAKAQEEEIKKIKRENE